MSRKVIDRTAECRDALQRNVPLDRRSLIVIHRVGASLGENAAAIAKAFREVPGARNATGGEMPYHFVIGKGGCIEQALAISERGPHARGWSTRGLGVACVGDFRLHKPTPLQWQSLVWLCSELAQWLTGPNGIKGHTELDNATWDVNKLCPGPLLDLDELRLCVKEEAALRLSHLDVLW